MPKIDRNWWLIVTIIIFAAVVRFAGINYGLPLFLIHDEPPFVLGALKMLQLKSLLPVNHLGDFSSVLYYPPYLSYLYLIPFATVVGTLFLFWHGSLAMFPMFIALDLTPFFWVSRIITVLLSLVSIWLVYLSVRRIFKSDLAGMASALFLATSVLHISLSMVGRHWLAVSFLFALVLYILSHPKLSAFGWRYPLAVLAVGIGIGVSTVAVLAVPFILFWAIFVDRISFADTRASMKGLTWLSLAFVILAILPNLIFPKSQGFLVELRLFSDKNLLDMIISPLVFLGLLIKSEMILATSALVGLFFTFRNYKKIFWTLVVSIFTYSVVFYIFFRYEQRFGLPILIWLAPLAGYGVASLTKYLKTAGSRRVPVLFLILIFLLPVLSAGKFGLLAWQGDTRQSARTWVENNIPDGSRVVVYGDKLRLASSPETILELNKISPESIRQVDLAESVISPNSRAVRSFQALNLYSVSNQKIFEQLPVYLKTNSYEYLVLDQEYVNGNEAVSISFKNIISDLNPIYHFDGDSEYSIASTNFHGWLTDLFKISQLGPTINIYKLK